MYNNFLIKLSNTEKIKSFIGDFLVKTKEISEKIKKLTGKNWFAIKTTESINQTTIEILTSELVSVNVITDAVQESLPNHGIAIFPKFKEKQ